MFEKNQTDSDTDLSDDDDDESEDDDNDNTLDSLDYNIIVKASDLKNLIENNFICKHYVKSNCKRSNISCSFCTFGLATEITCSCQVKDKR